MSAKHFVNDPAILVHTSLQAVTLANPSVALDPTNKILYLRPDSAHASPRSQVSIVSGGGSGHEPSFGALVGRGLLSAAVAGTIFASPSAQQVHAAIVSRVDKSRGVLLIVMNYTGDVLNFGLAVEKARASGHRVEMVMVGDDVGVGRAKAGKVGRRGIAGVVLVHKLAGALAARGADLDTIAAVARLAAANLVSVAASLEHAHVPGRDAVVANGDALLPGEVEIGMGIHNEPGSGRARVDLQGLVSRMLAQLLDPRDLDRAFLDIKNSQVVLLVNNLGGVSVLEMGAILAEVVLQLEASYKIRAARILSGTFVTSLNAVGFSITLLNTVDTAIGGPSMIELLDDPCEALGWAAPIEKETWEAGNIATREGTDLESELEVPSGLGMDPEAAKAVLTAGLESVVAAEPEVTRYDTIVGDGDCGIGLQRGAMAILEFLSYKKLSGDAAIDVASITSVVESTMDGTSGAIYSIFLNALVVSLRTMAPGQMTTQIWAAALKKSLDALSKYTPARPGDRTLLDALCPFIDCLTDTGDARKAADAARKAAIGTKGMQASLGRAVYVGGLNFEKVPDPGAWGLACFLSGAFGSE